MALTHFQRSICRLLAERRRSSGESYVAGGAALNQLLNAPRLSHDIDLFHDSEEALAVSWEADRRLLESNHYTVTVLRQSPAFVEAWIAASGSQVIMQWVRDSAYRHFPLLEDELFGLVLHPFDLATNKVLAMAGRLEPRDWIDVIHCHHRLQSLGLLAWAACGKDPGFNPQSLLAESSRAHYSQAELDGLAFDGPAPDAITLGGQWRTMLKTAAAECALLPASELGKCVINNHLELFQGTVEELRQALENGSLRVHEGRLGGAWPSFK